MTEPSPETAAPAPDAQASGAGPSAISFHLITFCWTLLILLLAGWDYYQVRQSALDNARTAARHSYAKDLTFRKWATGHGGVYAPVTPANPPNANLAHIPERDIQTPSGRPLTLINPATILRQVHQLADETFGTRAHITSLRPIRPANAPDPWEVAALQAFERGENERSELQSIDGEPYLRLMRPFVVDTGCLKCHAAQGYQMGNIRGGISIAIPWAPYRAHLRSYLLHHSLGYGGLWSLGMLGLGASRRRLQNHLRERDRAEALLREERQRLTGIIEGTRVGTWEWNVQTGETIFNETWAEMIGYHLDELRPLSFKVWERLVQPDDLLRSRELLERHFSGEFPYYDGEYRMRHKDGHWVWVHDRGRLLNRDAKNRPLMMFGTHTDISARKEAEEALRQKAQELEERGAELERFNYTVSHDLKSPLVTVKSFLGFLEQDIAGRDAERIPGDIEHMRTATEKMGRLLDELLEMSRIGRVVNPPEKFSFKELLEEVLALMAGPLAERGVAVATDDKDPLLRGDRPRLLEIWQNLLENAVKYMGDQGAPRIELGMEEADGESVFFVRDNGQGIDPRYHEKIFGLFEKLDPKSEGSGLGLAVVKRIVELYGGRIWVESPRPGQGCCFRFTLPGALPQR
ncbi:ATP-binding protein [Trichloromonas sp.]|uniref:ATP-binding protein n=1 Tax=Trichloromonas sp. TaxID=3069249 RepID=UPI002A4C9C2E|nr:ATP-binding protein [Trichloromonas sp.]